MKTIDLHWRDKRELSRILNGLRALGDENADGLTPKYRFPVIVVDLDGRRFFRSHASFMTAGIVRGTSDLREWDEVADVISAHVRSRESVLACARIKARTCALRLSARPHAAICRAVGLRQGGAKKTEEHGKSPRHRVAGFFRLRGPAALVFC